MFKNLTKSSNLFHLLTFISLLLHILFSNAISLANCRFNVLTGLRNLDTNLFSYIFRTESASINYYSVPKAARICCSGLLLSAHLLRQRVSAGEPEEADSLDLGGNLPSLEVATGNTSALEARLLRDILKNYYNSPVGGVNWQDDKV